MSAQLAKKVLEKVLPQVSKSPKSGTKTTDPLRTTRAPDSVLKEFGIVDQSTLPEFQQSRISITDEIDAHIERANNSSARSSSGLRKRGAVGDTTNRRGKPWTRGRPVDKPDEDDDGRPVPLVPADLREQPKDEKSRQREAIAFRDHIDTRRRPKKPKLPSDPDRPKECAEIKADYEKFGLGFLINCNESSGGREIRVRAHR